MRYVVHAAMALICVNLRAQAPPDKPEFEVASVKPAANEQSGGLGMRLREMMRSGRPPGMIPMDSPGRVHLENWALLDLIAAAYNVRATQVSGPAWLSDQGFDIEAKVTQGTPKEALNAMLRSLLEERFGLKVHRDKRTGQGFALVVGKNGPKLKPAEAPPGPQKRAADQRKRVQEDQESGTARVGLSRANFPSITTEQLAFQLERFAEATVADETGLTGTYHVAIETWKNADVPGGTLFDAVEKLGLKLEARKVSIETVVVDQVHKMPTGN